MLITKFDLYKGEWLDLVFDNRNKSYGAYDLRKHYASNMLKAMGITFSAVAAGIFIFSLVLRPVVENIPLVPDGPTVLFDATKFKPIEPPKTIPKTEAPKPSGPKPDIKTAVIPTVVTENDSEAVEPTKNEDLKTAVISTTESEGKSSEGNAPEGSGTTPGGKGEGKGADEGDDTGVHETFEVLERMPEPVGGQQAWTKFLQRNLRFPEGAEVNGRVFLSFIIEKDGTLTSIKVERGGEYGFGEEALRVLKKAPAWKPGIQNGRPVRVKYVIPISFRLPE